MSRRAKSALDFLRDQRVVPSALVWLGDKAEYDQTTQLLLAAGSGTRHLQPVLANPNYTGLAGWVQTGGTAWSDGGNKATHVPAIEANWLYTTGGTPPVTGNRLTVDFELLRCAGGSVGVKAPRRGVVGIYREEFTIPVNYFYLDPTIDFDGDVGPLRNAVNLSLASALPLVRTGVWGGKQFAQGTAVAMPWDVDFGTFSNPKRHAIKAASGDYAPITPGSVLQNWTIYFAMKADAVGGGTARCILGTTAGDPYLLTTAAGVVQFYDGTGFRDSGFTPTTAPCIVSVSKYGTSYRFGLGEQVSAPVTGVDLALSQLTLFQRGSGGIATQSGECRALAVVSGDIMATRLHRMVVRGMAQETGVQL